MAGVGDHVAVQYGLAEGVRPGGEHPLGQGGPISSRARDGGEVTQWPLAVPDATAVLRDLAVGRVGRGDDVAALACRAVARLAGRRQRGRRAGDAGDLVVGDMHVVQGQPAGVRYQVGEADGPPAR